MLRGTLSRIDRRVSMVLAVVWLGVGLVGLVVGSVHASVSLLAVFVPVAAGGAVWAVVAWRGKLLDSPPR